MKYLIEFDDEYTEEDGLKYYQCKEIPWMSISGDSIKRLTPVDMDECGCISSKAKALCELWEYFKIVVNMDDEDRRKAFANSDIRWIMDNCDCELFMTKVKEHILATKHIEGILEAVASDNGISYEKLFEIAEAKFYRERKNEM